MSNIILLKKYQPRRNLCIWDGVLNNLCQLRNKLDTLMIEYSKDDVINLIGEVAYRIIEVLSKEIGYSKYQRMIGELTSIMINYESCKNINFEDFCRYIVYDVLCEAQELKNFLERAYNKINNSDEKSIHNYSQTFIDSQTEENLEDLHEDMKESTKKEHDITKSRDEEIEKNKEEEKVIVNNMNMIIYDEVNGLKIINVNININKKMGEERNKKGLGQIIEKIITNKNIDCEEREKGETRINRMYNTYVNSHFKCNEIINREFEEKKRRCCTVQHYTGECKYGKKCIYYHCKCYSNNKEYIDSEKEQCNVKNSCNIMHFTGIDVYRDCEKKHCGCYEKNRMKREREKMKESKVEKSRTTISNIENGYEFDFPKLY